MLSATDSGSAADVPEPCHTTKGQFGLTEANGRLMVQLILYL